MSTGGAATPATRIHVLPALCALHAVIAKVDARRSGRGCGRRSHADVGQCRLVSAVRGSLLWGTDRDRQLLLLLKLLWELKSVRMRRHVGHLSLDSSKGCTREVVLWLYHAQVDILLVLSSDVLLLLLQHLDLLSDSKLLH